jgi:protein-tyrosine phosphatase
VDVPDPYHGIQSNFDQVFEMLEEACDTIATKMLKKYSEE